MLNLAKRSNDDRAAIFTSTALKIGMNEAIVEKDFWVCCMLEILFHHCEYANSISFKGGTSLSKGYGIIQRFSEDIDLILDWRILGYGINEPYQPRSITAQERFNIEINNKTADFLREILMPQLQSLIIQQGIESSRFYIEETDLQTIRFVYPQLYTDESLIQEIRLEIGSLAAWTPLTTREITPFVSEQFPHLFDKLNTKVRTVEAKRTFWEKATILHSEANRLETKIPQRYSRHYYDLYMLYKSHIKAEAFADFELLEKVAIFKQKFYRSNRSRYDEANKDGLRLMPPKASLKDLQNDYNSMQTMIFGEVIHFETILNGLSEMLEEIKLI